MTDDTIRGLAVVISIVLVASVCSLVVAGIAFAISYAC